MSLQGANFNQFKLQESFYDLFEPELESCRRAFMSVKTLQKHHKKKFPKFSKDYLLDKLELNVKSRCVFAWSGVATIEYVFIRLLLIWLMDSIFPCSIDSEYTGFKPLPDDHVILAEDALRSRQLYFKEATTVASGFMTDYCAEMRIMYEDRRDFYATVRNGVIFIVGTCLLDWLVCGI